MVHIFRNICYILSNTNYCFIFTPDSKEYQNIMCVQKISIFLEYKKTQLNKKY